MSWIWRSREPATGRRAMWFVEFDLTLLLLVLLPLIGLVRLLLSKGFGWHPVVVPPPSSDVAGLV